MNTHRILAAYLTLSIVYAQLTGTYYTQSCPSSCCCPDTVVFNDVDYDISVTMTFGSCNPGTTTLPITAHTSTNFSVFTNDEIWTFTEAGNYINVQSPHCTFNLGSNPLVSSSNPSQIWAGSWYIDSEWVNPGYECCFPDSPIQVTQLGADINATLTFGNSAACQELGWNMQTLMWTGDIVISDNIANFYYDNEMLGIGNLKINGTLEYDDNRVDNVPPCIFWANQALSAKNLFIQIPLILLFIVSFLN